MGAPAIVATKACCHCVGAARELCPGLTYLRCSQDPDGFIDNGGWNFLDAEGDGSDEDGEESEEEGELMSLKRPHASQPERSGRHVGGASAWGCLGRVQGQSVLWHA